MRLFTILLFTLSVHYCHATKDSSSLNIIFFNLNDSIKEIVLTDNDIEQYFWKEQTIVIKRKNANKLKILNFKGFTEFELVLNKKILYKGKIVQDNSKEVLPCDIPLFLLNSKYYLLCRGDRCIIPIAEFDKKTRRETSSGIRYNDDLKRFLKQKHLFKESSEPFFRRLKNKIFNRHK
jgi:hypothetical protein